MSWSSNNDDNSPWGKSSSNKKKPYNGSEGGNNDDFIDNLQEKLKGYFPKKNKPASLSAIILITILLYVYYQCCLVAISPICIKLRQVYTMEGVR